MFSADLLAEISLRDTAIEDLTADNGILTKLSLPYQIRLKQSVQTATGLCFAVCAGSMTDQPMPQRPFGTVPDAKRASCSKQVVAVELTVGWNE